MPGKEAKVYAVLKSSVLSAISYGGVLPFDIAGKLRSLKWVVWQLMTL